MKSMFAQFPSGIVNAGGQKSQYRLYTWSYLCSSHLLSRRMLRAIAGGGMAALGIQKVKKNALRFR